MLDKNSGNSPLKNYFISLLDPQWFCLKKSATFCRELTKSNFRSFRYTQMIWKMGKKITRIFYFILFYKKKTSSLELFPRTSRHFRNPIKTPMLEIKVAQSDNKSVSIWTPNPPPPCIHNWSISFMYRTARTGSKHHSNITYWYRGR